MILTFIISIKYINLIRYSVEHFALIVNFAILLIKRESLEPSTLNTSRERTDICT